MRFWRERRIDREDFGGRATTIVCRGWPGNLQSANGDWMTYDAENRQIAATEPPSLGGATENYYYDGDGRRVEKSGPAGTTAYIYDAFGQLTAEYSTAGSGMSCTTCYLSYDHLGSVRLVTDQANNVISRHDFLPFGEEIPAGIAGRSGPGWGSTDGVSQRFTGKERDQESGLDYFGARYYGAALGRFTSPDPLLNSGRPEDPQSWNRYVYALNNPLAIIDPNGLYNLVNTCDSDNKKCNKQFNGAAKNLKNGLSQLQNQLKDVKDPVQRARLATALKAMGTENDGNNVNVSFGKTKDGGAGATDPNFDQKTNSYSGFNVTLDPGMLKNADSMAIAGAHEGTHVEDYESYQLNPATTMYPFQLEYRGYQTSAWAASALGYSSLSPQYNGKSYEIWNSSWGLVDSKLTQFITSFHDNSGQQTHPEVQPHNPLPN